MSLLPVALLHIVSFCVVVFNFFHYLVKGSIKTRNGLFKVIQIWTVIIVPLLLMLMFDIWERQDCCTDSTLFSPENRTGIYILILSSMAFYGVSIYKKRVLPPVAELLTNAFLILGLIINVLVAIQIHPTEAGLLFWFFGNVPIILLLLIELDKNNKRIKQHIEQNKLHSNNAIGMFCLYVLKQKPLSKYPALTIVLIPIIVLLSLFLLQFGQKPDSMIRAFTDTYKHGFSQLDHLCDNIQCGGHFLCSVGANGHKAVVKPIRYGERQGHKIICNRQLLISNAFEDLVQDKFPKIHKIIRKSYNRVGDGIHKHYHIFNNKWISDVVYLFMKPLELTFLIILYTCDHKPENRIAIQYLNKADRERISNTATKK